MGTRRRLQALAAAGWSAAQLAARLEVTRGAVASLRDTRQQRVLATTAAAVAALYEDCWWRTPPGRSRDLARTETWAVRHGWPDPSRWHGRDLDDPAAAPASLVEEADPVAIAEAIASDPVSWNDRKGGCELPLQNVQVRSADPARRDVNDHLARPGPGIVDDGDLGLADSRDNGGLHVTAPSGDPCTR